MSAAWTCWTARASTRVSAAPAIPSCRWCGSSAAIVGEPHGGWVHWGATTQNITQTGDLLVLRQAHGIFLRLIGEALTAMADLAERGAEMPMPGRTHGQHAVPATFGYKVAVWIDELLRHVERLRQAAPRLFVAMLGGGAGTFASLGEQGPPVQAGIGQPAWLRHRWRCRRARSATTWPRTSACWACSPPPAARSAARSTR